MNQTGKSQNNYDFLGGFPEDAPSRRDLFSEIELFIKKTEEDMLNASSKLDEIRQRVERLNSQEKVYVQELDSRKSRIKQDFEKKRQALLDEINSLQKLFLSIKGGYDKLLELRDHVSKGIN